MLCRVRSYSLPGLPRPITSFMRVCLPTILQARRQELRQAGLDDLLLCFLEIVGHAIKFEAALAVVDHKSGAWISVARLPDSPGVHYGAEALRRFPVAFRRRKHLIRYLDHALAQPQQ